MYLYVLTMYWTRSSNRVNSQQKNKPLQTWRVHPTNLALEERGPMKWFSAQPLQGTNSLNAIAEHPDEWLPRTCLCLQQPFTQFNCPNSLTLNQTPTTLDNHPPVEPKQPATLSGARAMVQHVLPPQPMPSCSPHCSACCASAAALLGHSCQHLAHHLVLRPGLGLTLILGAAVIGYPATAALVPLP